MNRLKKFFTGLKSSSSPNTASATQKTENGGDRNVQQWTSEDKKAIKLLIFGGAGSGKNTLCKQMKIIHSQNRFTDQDRTEAATAIRELIRESVQELVGCMVSGGVAFSDETIQTSLEYCNTQLVESTCWQTKNFYEHIKLLYKQEITTDYLAKLTDSNISDNLDYFLTNLASVSSDTYVPSDDDMLRCKDRADHLTNHLKVPVTLSRNDLFFSILAVRDTSLLPPILPHTQAVLFTADLHSFALKSPRDLLTTLDHFQQLIASRLLPDVHVILLLNKLDRLEAATASGSEFGSFVETVDVSHPCHAFIQTWHSWEGASLDEQRLFVESFPTRDGEAPAVMDAHQRRASFRKKSGLLQTMMKRKGVQQQTVQTGVFIRRLFQDVFTHVGGGGAAQQKGLSVYYTCLIDDYTSRRVCESWRNMLLVDTV